MLHKLPIVTVKVGLSVEDSDETRKVSVSSTPRQRNWIDLPLDRECLLQVELKRRTLDRAKVSKTLEMVSLDSGCNAK